MKARSELHELILSLTPAERKMVLQRLRMHSGTKPGRKKTEGGKKGSAKPQLQKLFEGAPRRSETWEDEDMLQLLPRTAERQLPKLKSELVEMILDVLIPPHAQQDPVAELLKQMQVILLLQSRNLHVHANRIRDLTTRKAEELEHWPVLMQVLQEAIRAVQRECPRDALSQIHALTARYEQVQAWQLREQKLNALRAELFVLQKQQEKDAQFGPAQRIEYEHRVTELDPGEGAPFILKHLFLNTQALYFWTFRDERMAYSCYLANVRLWENTEGKIHQYGNRFFTLMSNFLGVCYKIGDFGPFEDALATMEGLKASTPSEELIQEYEVLNYRFLHSLYTRRWERAEALIPKMEALVKKSVRNSKLRNMKYNILLLYWLRGDWEGLRRQAGELSAMYKGSQDDKVVRMDLQRLCKTIEAVSWWEESPEVMQRQATALQNNHFKKQKPDTFLYEFLLMLQRLRVDAVADKVILKEWLAEWEAYATTNATGATELIAWARAQAHGTAFADEALRTPASLPR